MKNSKKYFFLLLFILMSTISGWAQSPAETGKLSLHFMHEANGKKIIQRDSLYLNAFREPYRIHKLRYYISNVSLDDSLHTQSFLIDAFATDAFSIDIAPGEYQQLEFLLGVDSVIQTSGAQSGALDPLKGMYWTWNSGYINFKLEGSSDSSHADLQRIEHHIGGYRKPYETMRKIKLQFAEPLKITGQDEVQINILLNLDKYWKGTQDVKIKDQALIMSSGVLPHQISDNFMQLFSIHSIQYIAP